MAVNFPLASVPPLTLEYLIFIVLRGGLRVLGMKFLAFLPCSLLFKFRS